MHKVHGTATLQDSPLTRRDLFAGWRKRRGRGAGTKDWIRVSRTAMACRFEAIVAPECKIAIGAAQEYLEAVNRVESILSLFRPESEVSVLNREAAEHPVRVGPELFALLKFCERLHSEADGAFDVTSGALSKCWGFEDRRPSVPSSEALEKARESSGFHRILLEQDGAVFFRSAGIRINFGGIGKGYALDEGSRKMRARGIATALLSAGNSSVLAMGSGPDGAGWCVGLRHPIFKDQRIGTVQLRSCALGTSGQEEQFFEMDGRHYGHILDPRSGFPVRGVASATVLADSATQADALATTFFVGGVELAERYCSTHPGIVAIMLLESDLSRPIVIGSSDRVEVKFGNV